MAKRITAINNPLKLRFPLRIGYDRNGATLINDYSGERIGVVYHRQKPNTPGPNCIERFTFQLDENKLSYVAIMTQRDKIVLCHSIVPIKERVDLTNGQYVKIKKGRALRPDNRRRVQQRTIKILAREFAHSIFSDTTSSVTPERVSETQFQLDRIERQRLRRIMSQVDRLKDPDYYNYLLVNAPYTDEERIQIERLTSTRDEKIVQQMVKMVDSD